jgi:soluble lytic murein transglycosylase-like protein
MYMLMNANRYILAGFVLGLLLVFCGTSHADIYTYARKDGSTLVTSSPRKGLKLIEVIRDDASSASNASAPGKKAKKPVSARHAKIAEQSRKKRDRARVLKGAKARSESSYDHIIREAAEAYELPFSFIKGVIKVESNFNPYAVSRTGAMGLMQLMPGTAKYVGVEDAFDPRQNIFGGAKLLRILTNQYNGDINLLLSAYNAGRGAVARYDGIPYEGTREYVRRVYRHYKRYQGLEGDEQ